MIVIGGGAAGPSAAAKAKRLDRELEVHMFDEGPHVSYAACPTPYFVADRIQGTEKIIARTPEEFEKAGVHVHVNTGIVDLDMKAGTAKDSTGKKWPFDVAVYATGASSKIPNLRGIVPICASCKKIGDDQGYWHQVEVYVRDHSEADFSHSLCPECMKKLYPEFEQEDGDSDKNDRGEQ